MVMQLQAAHIDEDEQVLVVRRLACGCEDLVPPEQDPKTTLCRECRAERDRNLVALAETC